MKREVWQRTELAVVEDISAAMNETSICGLGEVAANPLTTLITYFQQDLDRRLSTDSVSRSDEHNG